MPVMNPSLAHFLTREREQLEATASQSLSSQSRIRYVLFPFPFFSRPRLWRDPRRPRKAIIRDIAVQISSVPHFCIDLCADYSCLLISSRIFTHSSKMGQDGARWWSMYTRGPATSLHCFVSRNATLCGRALIRKEKVSGQPRSGSIPSAPVGDTCLRCRGQVAHTRNRPFSVRGRWIRSRNQYPRLVRRSSFCPWGLRAERPTVDRRKMKAAWEPRKKWRVGKVACTRRWCEAIMNAGLGSSECEVVVARTKKRVWTMQVALLPSQVPKAKFASRLGTQVAPSSILPADPRPEYPAE